MVVHHVEMNPISASSNNAFELIAQTGEIGGQNGWGNAVDRFTHGQIVAARNALLRRKGCALARVNMHLKSS
jgi:hypothetical protein